ncbi:hypothetical protein VHEMI02543 [[Torrubiella] hemipterigena]|uniref:DUF6590 domain-containing protein n=1 Tax=[Torrubiella] hemipterigena TaxID=1531966 RepID=A0A0A1SPX5_9HYPO|nr:hypothetical protein VHEMI02543 [[Torrubiella] hemipterigena]
MMQKQKHKTKASVWSDWSDWEWNGAFQAFGRIRRDADGNVEYEWEQPKRAGNMEQQTPREATIEGITEGIANLPAAHTETQYDEYAYIMAASKAKQRAHGDPRRGGHPSGSSHGSGSRSEAQTKTPNIQYDEQAQYYQMTEGAEPFPEDASSYYGTQIQGVAYSHVPGAQSYFELSQTKAANHLGQTTPQRPRLYTRSSLSTQSSSTGALYQGTGGEVMESGSAALVGGSTIFEGEQESRCAPIGTMGRPVANMPAVADDGTLELDPRYKVEHSSKFEPGEVFKVHWSEPQGTGGEGLGGGGPSNSNDIQNKFGSKFFVGFRRFIVVANDHGHCTCVPILTYGGKACKKKGVKPEKHGIIIEQGQKPRRLDGEPALGFGPVRMIMRQDSEKLSKESRVNYSKLVTIEHNIKVFFIGSVLASDYHLVGEAVNQCWSKKILSKPRPK